MRVVNIGNYGFQQVTDRIDDGRTMVRPYIPIVDFVIGVIPMVLDYRIQQAIRSGAH